MKISFFGAASEVTGSNYLLELANGYKIMVDCGLFQGSHEAQKRNGEDFKYPAEQVDVLLLTHAHLDHTGRLPKLVKEGFKGKVYTTLASSQLTQIVLDDALGLMQEHSERENIEPLYSQADFNALQGRFINVEYHQAIDVGGGAKATFYDAGHILGSAFIKVVADGKTITFSGDLGNPPVPIIQPTEALDQTETLIIESTYGGRVHEPMEERTRLLSQAIKETISASGTLMIPAFAIERTQELLFEINHLIEDKKIPPVPVYLDSPMAIKATKIFRQSVKYYNETSKQESKTDDLFNFPGLTLTESVVSSKQINSVVGSKIIIAGSGMMEGGRILHHAIRYLPDKKSRLLIVGYQVEGSFGRRLLDGEKVVKIHSQPVRVNAKIQAIGAYSAHADQPKLLHFISQMNTKPKNIFITHGELSQSQALASKIKDEFRINSIIPKFGQMENI